VRRNSLHFLRPTGFNYSETARRVPLLVEATPLENGQFQAHICGWTKILPPQLSEVELEALRQIAAHPVTSHIPSRVQSRLKDIGYAKEVLGDLVLTDDGLQRIAEAK
jgi:hypothetical protein